MYDPKGNSTRFGKCQYCQKKCENVCCACRAWYCDGSCIKMDWVKHKNYCKPRTIHVDKYEESIKYVQRANRNANYKDNCYARKGLKCLSEAKDDVKLQTSTEKSTTIPADRYTKIVVSWVDEHFCWAFMFDDAETQSNVEEKLNAYCTSTRAKHISPDDNKCCAPFDGGWYRAKILSKDNDTAMVRFIDFGNDASIKLSDALKVPDELLLLKPIAFKVRFANGKPNGIAVDHVLDVKATKQDGDICEVEIQGMKNETEINCPPLNSLDKSSFNSQDTTKINGTSAYVTNSKTSSNTQQRQNICDITNLPRTEINEKETCKNLDQNNEHNQNIRYQEEHLKIAGKKDDRNVQVLTKTIKPPIPTDRFTKIVISWIDEHFCWAFKFDDAETQSIVEEKLNVYCTSTHAKCISPDDNKCCAPFDGGWYRAKILSKDNDTGMVRFIDFGNDASIKLCDALKVPDELLLLKPIAFKVRFANGNPNGITVDHVLDVKAVKQDGEICEVEIQGMKNETEINCPPLNSLDKSSFNSQDTTKINGTSAYVTNSKTSSNTQQRQNICDITNLPRTEINEKETCKNLDQNNEHNQNIRYQEEHLKIAGKKDDRNVQVLTKTIKPPIPTDRFTKIVISWIDTHFCWAFKFDDAETQSIVEEKLNVYCTSTHAKRISPEDNKCCALFDGGWYRAKILSKDNDTGMVRFIDFGNDASIKLSDALKVPDELLLLKPIAFKVRFVNGKPNGITVDHVLDVKAMKQDGDICEVEIQGMKNETEIKSPPLNSVVESSFNNQDPIKTSGSSVRVTSPETSYSTQQCQNVCDISNYPTKVKQDQSSSRQKEIVNITNKKYDHNVSTKATRPPIPTDKFTKIVVSWVDEHFCWAFKFDDAETQSIVEEKLNRHCTSTQAKRISPDDNKCCAPFDGGWYRAKILSKVNDTAMVRFIDFGNDASIKLSEALKVPDELLLLKPIAFKVRFVNGKPNGITVDHVLDVKATKQDGDICEVEIQGMKNETEINSLPLNSLVESSFNNQDTTKTSGSSVHVTSPETSYSTQQCQNVCDISNYPTKVIQDQSSSCQKEIVNVANKRDNHNLQVSTKAIRPPIPTDKFTKIVVSWIDEHFCWAFKFDDAETQSSVEEKLNDYCTSTHAKRISPDDNKCCAPFDGGWYRAKILSKDNDTAMVRFIDFGNDASIKLSDALKVPDELLLLKPIAFKVRFPNGKPNGITVDHVLDVKAMKQDGDICEVEIQGMKNETEIKSPPLNSVVESSFNNQDTTKTNGSSVHVTSPETSYSTQQCQNVCYIRNLPTKVNQDQISSYQKEIVKIGDKKDDHNVSTKATVSPIPTDKFTKIVISWIEEHFYWAFRFDDAETQSKIEEKLNVYCTSARAKQISPDDNKCCAPYDGGWYRAKILSKHNNTAAVQFIDFGNPGSIKLSDALKVPEELLLIKPMAFKVRFAGGKPNRITENDAFDVKAINQDAGVCVVQLQGCPINSEMFSEITSPPSTVLVNRSSNHKAGNHVISIAKTIVNTEHCQNKDKLLNFTYSIINENAVCNKMDQCSELNKQNCNGEDLSHKNELTKIPDKKDDHKTQVSAIENIPPIPTDRFTEIVISWVDKNFYWAFRLDNAETQAEIEEELNVYCVSAHAKRISPDDNKCCAPFDGGWYRAKILSKDNDTAMVRFIDFGNDASIKLSDALKVPDKLKHVKPLAFRIKLEGKETMFEMDKKYNVKAIKMDAGVCSVELEGYSKLELPSSTTELTSLSDSIIICPAPGISNIDISSPPRIPVLHVPSTRMSNHLLYQLKPSSSKISVQLQTFIGENCMTGFISVVDDTEKSNSGFASIKDITEQLSATKADPKFKPSLKDEVCAQVNGIWYRGYVTQMNPDVINVALVDLGVIVVPDGLAPLPQHVKVIAETAVRCIFSTPQKNLTNLLGEQFTFKNLQKEAGKLLGDTDKFGEVAILPWEPTYEDSGLISENIKSGAQYKLTAFHSPNEIYVQSQEQNCASSLDNLMQDVGTHFLKVPSLIRKPWCGQLVSCLSPKSNKYFRSQVLKKLDDLYEVKFIDFGLIETVALSNMKSLSDELKSVPCFATKVVLNGIPGSVFNKAATKIMNRLMEEDSLITITVENNSPTKVRLLDGETDINKLVYEAMLPSWSSQNKTDSVVFMSNDIMHEKWFSGRKMRLAILEVKAFNEILVINEESEVFAQALNMTKKIDDFCSCNTTPYNPRVQELCLAKYQDETGSNWYRAVCSVSYENAATVYFIDFGNYSEVSHTDIRKMPPQFLDHPAAPKTCKLYGLSDSLPDDVKESIINAYNDSYVDCSVVCDNNDGSTVLYVPKFMDILTHHNITSVNPPPVPLLTTTTNF